MPSNAISPAVSVFIASYNGERFVEQAVRSVLDQTFRNLELIIVDDASREPTREILRRLAASDERLRLFEDTHRGQIGTLNAAVAHCRAPLLARLDHDDAMLPERIARQVAFMNANPNVVAVGTATQKIDENGAFGRTEWTAPSDMVCRPQDFPPSLQFLMGPTLMVRAEAMRTVGAYREEYKAAEDRDLSWRLGRLGKTGHIHEPLTCHRDHAGSLGLTQNATQAFSHLLCDLSAIAAHFGKDDSDARNLIEVGRRYQPALDAYARLLNDVYPARALIALSYTKSRFRGLPEVPSARETIRSVLAELRRRPFDTRIYGLIPRLARLAIPKKPAPKRND